MFETSPASEFFSVIRSSFPNSHLKEAHDGFLHIQIDQADLSLANLFRVIDSCKEMYSIENYTVSQTTLEQVFLTFALSQLDPNEMRLRTRVRSSWKRQLEALYKLGC